MYEHQVISDLQKHRSSYPDIHSNFIDSAIHTIKISYKYHFDLYENLNELMGKQVDGKPLFFQHTKYLKFPYNHCWFEYRHEDNDITKAGLLCMYNPKEESFKVIVFYYATSLKRWQMEPWSAEVYIGYVPPDADSVTNIRVLQIWKPFPAYNIKTLSHDNLRHVAFPIGFLEMAIRLLNCKNIGTVPVYPDLKLQKARVKKNKNPLFKYHILVVKPTGKKQKNAEAKGLWKLGVHSCCGHFKIYEPPHLLFGKYEGCFWWDPQWRGTPKEGVILKDYQINSVDFN